MAAQEPAITTLYVDPNGSDEDAGSSSKPFKTIEKAKTAVRALVAHGLTSDVRVVIRTGTYLLETPLVFSKLDSGSNKYSVTYAAVPNAIVVLSGGEPIPTWRRVDGNKWASTLANNRFFRQLTVNGKRAIRARWPNDDGQLRIQTVDTEVKTFTFDKPFPGADLSGTDAELVVFQNWSISRARIIAWSAKELMTATAVGWMGSGPIMTSSPGKPAYIENAEFALDQPREWWLDRANGTLTYIANNDEDMSCASIVATRLSQLVKIIGTADEPVRNLRFEGLGFEHSEFALPAEGYSEIQAAHYGPDMQSPTYVHPVAVECDYADGIQFTNCHFAHLNNSAIGFGPGSRNNVVEGCTIDDIGGIGVIVGWRGTGELKPGPEGTIDADWANAFDIPVGNVVSNCEITRCGQDSFGAPGLFVAFSQDTRIAHNRVHDLPYSGISVGYRWNAETTSQKRCTVEYNHIYDVMKKLADGGGIYTLGYQPGTLIRGNLIHDVHRSIYAVGGAPNDGFFIDEGSKGFHFEGNVVHSTSGDSVRFNQCQREWHTWESNFFDQSPTSPAIEAAKRKAGPKRVP